MLKKLLKYEIKATARIMLPLYLALIVFSLVNLVVNPLKLIESSENTVIQAIVANLSMMLYIVLIIGISVMTLVIMIQRFYKSLLGDEGYLMFTLPVEPSQHILSKLLVSLMWSAASFLTTLLSVAIISRIPDPARIIGELYKILVDFLGYTSLALIPIYLLAAACSGIMMVYTAIALGHLFNKHKLLASFGMYALLYMINQTVLSVCLFLIGTFIMPTLFMSEQPAPEVITFLMAFFSLVSIALAGAGFAVTNHILRNKLNLE
ncbi:MAG TPA: ABC transporter permease [Candidatus Atribacteria bacterium]|nr:ABC transporter permease [Candidatus Atribacteria bacterium]HPT78961.1 ABC transporter permease [Candidatus Atribacteria bacterium]